MIGTPNAPSGERCVPIIKPDGQGTSLFRHAGLDPASTYLINREGERVRP